MAGDQLSGLAVGKDAVWVIGDVGDQRLWRIDTSRPPLIPRATALGFDPADVAVGFGHVWVTGQITNKLYKIDPATGHVVQTIPVGREPMGVTVGDGAVWVADTIDGTISKVDPRTGTSATFVVGGSPIDVSVGDGSRLGGRGCELGDPGHSSRRSLRCITLIGCSAPPPPPAAGLDPSGSASSRSVRGPSRRIAI